MKHRRAQFITLLVTTCLPIVAHAQDSNLVIMQKLYSKIESQLNGGQHNNATNSVLVLAAPGFQLDSSVDFTQPEGRQQVYNFIDHTLQPSWILRFGTERESSVYNRIMHDSELPEPALTPQQLQTLEHAKHQICRNDACTRYTQGYTDYLKYKRALADAAEAIEDWQRQNPARDHIPQSMEDKWERANTDFQQLGNANVYAKAEQDRDSVENLSPATRWRGLQQQYDRNMLHVNSQQTPIYEFYPGYGVWNDNTTPWTKISLTDADLTATATSSHTSWGGGGSAGWGLWSVGGSYGKTEDRQAATSSAQHFALTFEIRRVLLNRPWMDPTVYGARNWRWKQNSNSAGQLISAGVAGDGKPPQGLAPLKPVELILARNVTLSGDWGTAMSTSYHSQENGGAHVGWGPFSFGGNYSHSYSQSEDHTTATANSLAAPDVQIIGVLADEVPLTPNPDPLLPWPKAAPATSFWGANIGPALFQDANVSRTMSASIDSAKAVVASKPAK